MKTPARSDYNFVAKGDENSGFNGYAIAVDQPVASEMYVSYYFQGPGSSLASGYGGSSLSSNTYYHIAVTYGSENVTFYLNGVKEHVTENAGPPTTGLGNLHFGFWPNSGKPYFNGWLDDVRIWNRALSASEVKQVYDGG